MVHNGFPSTFLQLNDVFASRWSGSAHYQLCDGDLHPTRPQVRVPNQVRPETAKPDRVFRANFPLSFALLQRKHFVPL